MNIFKISFNVVMVEFFSVIFIKIFKEDVQQGYPREVKGDEGKVKIVKGLA